MKKNARGFVHIYTGDGKGKTTAALGLALRASGAGLKVLVLQFLKTKATSEWKALRRLAGVKVLAFGRAGFIRSAPAVLDRQAARQGWETLQQALASGAYPVVIADEILPALGLGLITEAELLSALRGREKSVEVVLTGRGATPGLARAGDLVTEMRERKHYFRQGVKARKGIEY